MATRPPEEEEPLEWELREIEKDKVYGVKIAFTDSVYNKKLKIDIDPELIKDENGNKLEIEEIDLEMENVIKKDTEEETIDYSIYYMSIVIVIVSILCYLILYKAN